MCRMLLYHHIPAYLAIHVQRVKRQVLKWLIQVKLMINIIYEIVTKNPRKLLNFFKYHILLFYYPWARSVEVFILFLNQLIISTFG